MDQKIMQIATYNDKTFKMFTFCLAKLKNITVETIIKKS